MSDNLGGPGPIPRLFLADDGGGNPSLWLQQFDDDPRPLQVAMQGELHPIVWDLIEALAEPPEEPETVAPDHGQRCSSCGEYEGITVDHGPGWAFHGYATRRHTVCRNCDYGLCSGEC